MSDPYSTSHRNWEPGSVGPDQTAPFSDEIVIALSVFFGLMVAFSWLLLWGKDKMAKFTPEQRARLVMFMGIAILAILFIFGADLQQSLAYDHQWLLRDGWLHALGAALLLIGSWKWLATKESRGENGKDGH